MKKTMLKNAKKPHNKRYEHDLKTLQNIYDPAIGIGNKLNLMLFLSNIE